MADLLPSTPDLSAAEEADPRVVGVDSDDADDLISALSAGTARELLSALHDEPANPAALADRADTSLQNAQYHLSKLEDAGLVEVVDTVYSEKGREMNVYAPSDRPLVVYAGAEEDTSGLKAALSRLIGSLSVLALASLVVEQLFGGGGAGPSLGDGIGAPAGGDGAEAAQTATETPEEVDAAPTGTATVEEDAPTPDPTGTSTEVPGATDTPEATGTFAPTETSTPVSTESPTPVSTDTATEVAETTTETPADAVVDATREATPAVADAAAGIPPGLLFFLGGATVLVLGVLWYYRADLVAALSSAGPAR